MRLPSRKWVHPLKGRTIKEAMADALDEACRDKDGKGPTFDEREFWRNSSTDILYNGVCSWGTYQHQGPCGGNFHSWDSMRDCLKYGFQVGSKNEISANDNDWHQRGLEKEQESNVLPVQ